MSDWSDGFDWSSLFGSGDTGGVGLGDIGGGYDPRLDPGIQGDYDPRLDPNPGGAYDPRLDPGLQGGGAPAGGFPSTGVPAPGGGAGQRGLFTNPDGSPNWASILGVVAPLLGGAYTANQTGKANQQMQDAVKQANAQITQTLGGNSELFKPYRDAGAVGLNRLVNMPQSNLSSRYKPLGAGNGFSLGNIAKGQ